MNDEGEGAYLEDEDGLAHEHAFSHGGVLGEAVEDPADRSGDEEAHGGAGHSLEHLVVEGIAGRQEYVWKQHPGSPSQNEQQAIKIPASIFQFGSPCCERGVWTQFAMKSLNTTRKTAGAATVKSSKMLRHRPYPWRR